MLKFGTLVGTALAAAALAIAPASAQTVLRSADVHPDGYPTVEAVKYMGSLLKEATNGRYDIKVFVSEQLGSEKDTIEQTRFGVLDLNRVNMAPFNNLIPETGVLSLPFLFRSVDHMHKVVDGPIGDEILKAFEAHDLVGLAFYDSGARSLYTTKKPVRSLEDVKGLKIRVQQSDLFIGMVKAMGGNPTPMPYGEVYSALQTGVIDGAENNWPSLESSKHFEVAKFYTLTEHSLSPEVLVMSKKVWDKLTPEDQAAFRDAAKKSVAKMRELWQAREKKSEEIVRQAGVEVITIDKAPFEEAMKPFYASFVKDPKLQALVEKIRAVQ